MSKIRAGWETAHNALDTLHYLWNKGGQGLQALERLHQHSNDPINKIGLAVASPIAAIGGMVHGNGIGKTVEQVYGTLNSPKVGNIAGSAFTAGIGMGVASGLTHDSAGNVDIAGIPMI